LQGLEKYIKNEKVTDPFAGNQDLIKWAKNNGAKKLLVLIGIKLM